VDQLNGGNLVNGKPTSENRTADSRKGKAEAGHLRKNLGQKIRLTNECTLLEDTTGNQKNGREGEYRIPLGGPKKACEEIHRCLQIKLNELDMD